MPHPRPYVTAVISAFNPPQELAERVGRLGRQVDHVVVVDDGSTSDGAPPVHAALRAHGAEVVLLGMNSGIAAALNAGVGRATAAREDTWVLTLDQDSELGDEYVDAALRAFDDASADGLTVGAVATELLGDIPTPDEGSMHGHSLAYDPIQSGLLIPASTLETCGLFRSDLFIDSVDSEYTLRMRRHGLLVVRASGTRLEHAMGTPRPMKFLGRQLYFQGRPAHVPYQAPFRIYYITRNMLYLSQWYGREFPRWLARRWKAEVMHGAARLGWGPGRSKIALAGAAGVAAFLGRKRGKMPERLRRSL